MKKGRAHETDRTGSAIGAVPLIAYGQKAGTSILEGGGSGSFPVPTFATTVTNTFVLWGWAADPG